jgi:hypothetical protein
VIQCIWLAPQAVDGYECAVSLHSHTMFSREGMGFIPRMLRRAPLADAVLGRLHERCRRKTGRPIPFERAWWQPPLHPHAAYDLETRQIQDLGLRALVSLTDHDTIEACVELRAIGVETPYSVEWTVPYCGTVFHIGVHNLPPDQALELYSEMAVITASPSSERIAGLLAELHAMPDVLLVLNHPFSSGELIDRGPHVELLMQFLGEFGEWFHAYELNGLQCAANNRDTRRLASERGVPVISGGDRHCLEPNANLNLTNARTFTEFVHEIRVERRSSVLFMPQYRDPIPARYIEFIWHAVQTYPEFTGRERWVDRIFLTRLNGETVSCADEWLNGVPAVVRGLISLIGFLASPGMRPMLCRAAGGSVVLEPERVPESL